MIGKLLRAGSPALLFSLLSFASPSAHGQTSSDQRALAETLFFTARGLMEAKRYPEACRKLEESHRLDPAAGTLLNLARCHEMEGKIASAWGEYRQAISDARRANRPDREQVASERVAELEPQLPKLTVIVPDANNVPGLVVSRNGVALQQGGWSTPLPINPGEVVVTASAPGFETWKGTTQIALKGTDVVEIPKLKAEEKKLVAQAAAEGPSFWNSRRTTGAAIAGAGIASVAVGTVFGILALDQKQQSKDQCPTFDGEVRCTAQGAAASSSANTSAWVSNVSLVGGGVLAAVGSYLFFTAKTEAPPGSSPAVKEPARATLSVRPTAHALPGGAFGGVVGSF